MSSDDFDSNIVNLFKQEANKHILNINNNLLKIEKEGFNEKLLFDIKREAHTLKGDARMSGFSKISEASHKLEDLFDLLTKEKKELDKSLIDGIYKSLDIIQGAVNKLPGDEIDIDIDSVISFEFEDKASDDDKIDIFFDDFEPVKQEEPDKEEEVKEYTKENVKPETESAVDLSSDKNDDFININLKKIDDLISLFSAFPRYTNRFHYLINQLRGIKKTIIRKYQDDELIKTLDSVIYEFSHEITFYDLLSKEFQNEITNIKMVPLSNIFDLLPRLVRDIASNTKKKINFVVKGRDIELDKSIVDRLKEVLIHIINNAVDHGCESIEERIKAGKPDEGTVILSAYNKGDNVLIEITDDGHGINIDRVREKAIEKKLISKQRAENTSDEDILNFIFEAGFSTKEVSKYSGRGMGMDVVAKIVNKLNGEIKVNTWKNKGTTFVISLPLISSFIPVTIFRLKDKVFGLPSSFILQAMNIKNEEIKSIDNKKNYINLDDMEVTLINLSDLFNIEDEDINNHSHNIIIIKYQDEITGLKVTDIILEKKMVIKKITGIFDKFKLIIGAVLLGNEKAIPVLNIPEVFKVLKETKANVTKMKTKEHTKKIWAKNVLLVEDSIITREHEKKILLGQNLNVFEAANGKEAIRLLEGQKFDLIITDIEMPVMDGLELITFLKSSDKFSNIPVVVISSYKDYSEKLINMKVKHFINKADFSTQSFIEILVQENLL